MLAELAKIEHDAEVKSLLARLDDLRTQKEREVAAALAEAADAEAEVRREAEEEPLFFQPVSALLANRRQWLHLVRDPRRQSHPPNSPLDDHRSNSSE